MESRIDQDGLETGWHGDPALGHQPRDCSDSSQTNHAANAGQQSTDVIEGSGGVGADDALWEEWSRPAEAGVRPDMRLVGIGGWLLLPAIGLVTGPIATAYWLAHGGLSVPRTLAYVGYLVLAIFAAVRFFGKKTNAPYCMIVLYVWGYVAGIVNALDLRAELLAWTLVQGAISNGIWILYFLVSERVKATFVN